MREHVQQAGPMQIVDGYRAIRPQKLDVREIGGAYVSFCHHAESPATLPGVALRRTELRAVFRPVLAEIVAVLHLIQRRLGLRGLGAMGTIADEDVRRVSPTLPMGVMVDDLDGLFFEKLHIRIKIQPLNLSPFVEDQNGLSIGQNHPS